MKFRVLLTAVVVATAFSAHADESDTYKLPITRNGKTKIRIASNYWNGEYPGPVINVHAAQIGGFTKIQGYQSVRQLTKKVSCTVKNGLYHPWSQTDSSVNQFYTLSAVRDFLVKRDVQIEGYEGTIQLTRGSKVINVRYQSEGACGVTVVTTSGQRSELSVGCDEITENPALVQTTKPDDFEEQWIYLDCAEGYKAFVKDAALLATPGIVPGQITGYGEVGI